MSDFVNDPAAKEQENAEEDRLRKMQSASGHANELGRREAPWDPIVVAFACTYCAYTAADLAGAMRITYPTAVRVIQIPCTGRIDVSLLLQAFEEGADTVFVAGCQIGDCHFREGNIRGKEEVTRCRQLLAEVGLDPERLEFFHVPASAARLFAQCAQEMTLRAQQLGASPLRASVGKSFGEKLALPGTPRPALPPQQFGQLKPDREESQH